MGDLWFAVYMVYMFPYQRNFSEWSLQPFGLLNRIETGFADLLMLKLQPSTVCTLVSQQFGWSMFSDQDLLFIHFYSLYFEMIFVFVILRLIYFVVMYMYKILGHFLCSFYIRGSLWGWQMATFTFLHRFYCNFSSFSLYFVPVLETGDSQNLLENVLFEIT